MNAISEEKESATFDVSNLSSEVTVQIQDSTKTNKKIKGLLDTGAGGVHIKRSALKNTRYTVQNVNVVVTGQYSKRTIKQMAIFECKLIDFCSSRKVQVRAYIDEDAVGSHEIVFGKRFCAEIGIIMNYKTKTIIWDDLSIPMFKNRLTKGYQFHLR